VESGPCIRSSRLATVKRCTLPCENDQAKPDLFSRLARSTLLSKILKSSPPERRPWIEAQTVSPELSSNLLRWLSLRSNTPCNRFCANFLTLSNFLYRVNRLFSASPGPLQLVVDGHSPYREAPQTMTRKVPVPSSAHAQNIKERPAMLEPLRLATGFLPGLAMVVFSAGFPTGVQG
jgi:hypothetical protein